MIHLIHTLIILKSVLNNLYLLLISAYTHLASKFFFQSYFLTFLLLRKEETLRKGNQGWGYTWVGELLPSGSLEENWESSMSLWKSTCLCFSFLLSETAENIPPWGGD